MKEKKYSKEMDYDFVISKFPVRANLKNEDVAKLFEEEFTKIRLDVVTEILVGENILKYDSNFGWRLSEKGLYVKDDIRNKGFVALAKERIRKKRMVFATLLITGATLVFVILNFIFKK